MLLLLTGWAMMNLSLFFSSSESLLGTMQEEELKEKYQELVSRNCRILSSIVRTFFIENEAEILPPQDTWEEAFTNLIHKQSIQLKL
jgi:hypothetical protein